MTTARQAKAYIEAARRRRPNTGALSGDDAATATRAAVARLVAERIAEDNAPEHPAIPR